MDHGDDGLRGRIEAMAREYAFPEQAIGRLETLARWLDWEDHNYIPASVPQLPEPRGPLDPQTVRIASNAVREAVSALELEPVRAARRAADIGSGVGYPGLMLAIVLPHLHMTLIEPGEARCGFLGRAIAALRLDNVDVERMTVQEWSEGEARCGLVTSRGVQRPGSILELAAPLLAPGGAVVLFAFRSHDAAAVEAAGERTGLRLQIENAVMGENRGGELVVRRTRQLLYVKPPAAESAATGSPNRSTS